MIQTVKLSNEQVRELMAELGYAESTFEEYEKDSIEHEDKGLKVCQTACIDHNLRNYLTSSMGKNSVKKYYIVPLSNKVNDVRAWGFNE